MKRTTFILSSLFLSAVMTWECGHRTETTVATPATTVDVCAAALAAGPEQNDRDRAITRLQQDARKDHTARSALERLGFAYVARARINNDAGDYKLAEMAAACLDERYPGEPQTLLLRGHVLHQLHRFAEAEQIARVLIARRTFVLDYGLLGDALMEQGRLSEAAAAYQTMVDLKPFYQSYTRAAHLRWLKGDLDGARGMMRLATESASPRDPESVAWAWTRLAAYELQSGRLDAAMSAAETALRYQPDYAAALLAQGRILLARNRVSDAVSVLRNAARLNPLPEYQWVLADALRFGGLGAEADDVEENLIARGRETDPRTLALYLATRRTNVATAVSLAQDELRARHDVFTLDAHAWTLAASGRIAEAVPEIARAVGEGTRDGRLFLHAGLIHAAAGHSDEAQRWLTQANQLRWTLLPSEREELATHLNGTRIN